AWAAGGGGPPQGARCGAPPPPAEPPGSRLTTTPRPSACRRFASNDTCVDLPAPSPPSKVMNFPDMKSLVLVATQVFTKFCGKPVPTFPGVAPTADPRRR